MQNRRRVIVGGLCVSALAVFPWMCGAAPGAAPELPRPDAAVPTAPMRAGDWFFAPDGLDPVDRIGAFFPADPTATDIQDARRTRCSQFVHAERVVHASPAQVVLPVNAPEARVADERGDPKAHALVLHASITATWTGRVSDPNDLSLCCSFYPKDCGDVVTEVSIGTGHMDLVPAERSAARTEALRTIRQHTTPPATSRSFTEEPIAFRLSGVAPFVDGGCSREEITEILRSLGDRAALGRAADADLTRAWQRARALAVGDVLKAQLPGMPTDAELRDAHARVVSGCPATRVLEDGRREVSAISAVGVSRETFPSTAATKPCARAPELSVAAFRLMHIPAIPEAWLRDDGAAREEACACEVVVGPDRRVVDVVFTDCSEVLRVEVRKALLDLGRDQQYPVEPNGRFSWRFVFSLR